MDRQGSVSPLPWHIGERGRKGRGEGDLVRRDEGKGRECMCMLKDMMVVGEEIW